MTILMTGLCEKGADQIWKQCNDAMYAQGVTWLEEAAYAGDAEAWFFLGHCYSWGDGAVGFNEKKAYECYLRGASAGSARAVLGALRAGQYDEQMKQSARYSIEESYRQVRDAAEMGDVYAAWQMGEAVEWEDLADYMPQTESAREQCLFWYERAADGGIIPAMVKMGKCCQNGTYREKDEKEALRWANQCAASGEVWGLFQMGEHYRQEEDWEAAFQYDYAAAKQGSSRAMLYLGQMYLNGQGTERDIQAAVQALEGAAARNEAESFEELGNLFYQDELVARGVEMEGWSVEDNGESVCFNVFVYNVQPGISICYGDGTSSRIVQEATADPSARKIYGNRRSKIYHCPGQAADEEMKDSPNLVIFDSEEQAQAAGYRKAAR
mgnify:FL=1